MPVTLERALIEGLAAADVVDALTKSFEHRSHLIDLVSPDSTKILFGPAVTVGFFPVRKDLMDPHRHSLGPAIYGAVGERDPPVLRSPVDMVALPHERGGVPALLGLDPDARLADPEGGRPEPDAGAEAAGPVEHRERAPSAGFGGRSRWSRDHLQIDVGTQLLGDELEDLLRVGREPRALQRGGRDDPAAGDVGAGIDLQVAGIDEGPENPQ